MLKIMSFIITMAMLVDIALVCEVLLSLIGLIYVVVRKKNK